MFAAHRFNIHTAHPTTTHLSGCQTRGPKFGLTVCVIHGVWLSTCTTAGCGLETSDTRPRRKCRSLQQAQTWAGLHSKAQTASRIFVVSQIVLRKKS